jgi:hypothetical protein
VNVVSFTGFRPASRFDGQQWVSVRIEEATAPDGPWTVIDTIALPPQADPENPPEFSFTTELATLEHGWYAVVFIDDTGDEARASAVFNAAVPADGRRPGVDDVALLLRTRTVKGTNAGLGADTGPGDFTTFDATTRPSSAEVQMLINTAYGALAGKVPGDIGALPEKFWGAFSHVVAVYTAILVELSFFRNAEPTWMDEMRRFLDDGLQALLLDIERDQPALEPRYGFGSIAVGTTREKELPATADYMVGIDWDDAAGTLPDA